MSESGKPTIKWYQSTKVIVLAILTAGPFALPLIWFHPRYRNLTKITITIVVLGLTIWSFVFLRQQYYLVVEQLKALGLY